MTKEKAKLYTSEFKVSAANCYWVGDISWTSTYANESY